MNRRTTAALLALALSGLLLVSGCAGNQPRADEESKPLRIGMEATPVNSLIYIAEEQGYFEDNGLEVDIRDDYKSGAAATDAMLAGEVDVSTSAELGVVRNALADKPIVTHASIDKFLHQYLVGRKDRGIAKPEDLPGKRIGVPLGTGAEFNFDRYLDLQNIDKGQIEIVDVQAPEAVAALTDGTVDGVVAWQPNVATLLAQQGDKVVSWSVQNEQPTFCLTVTKRDWAEENTDVIERLLKALAAADDFAVDQPDQARELIQKRLDYDDAYMEQIWLEHELALSLDQSLILAMEDQGEWLVAQPSAETTALPDFADYVDAGPLRQVRPESVNLVR